MNRRLLAMMVALAATVACSAGSDGPPPIELDRSVCTHCGMLISEPRFAAAYRAPGTRHEAPATRHEAPRTRHDADAMLFDDIGCLLGAVTREADRSGIQYWFKDMNTAEWIDGDRAVFITSPRVRTPMAGGFVAYGDRTAAERGAAEHGERVIGSLDDLVKAHAGGGES